MKKVVVEHNVEVTTEYRRLFNWKDSDGGFGFECDEQGNVDVASLNPLARENYEKCVSGEHNVVDAGIDTSVYRVRLCPCGSGEHPEDLYDARNIYVGKCCDKCKPALMRKYRPEIFTDSNYECDEQIDEDY